MNTKIQYELELQEIKTNLSEEIKNNENLSNKLIEIKEQLEEKMKENEILKTANEQLKSNKTNEELSAELIEIKNQLEEENNRLKIDNERFKEIIKEQQLILEQKNETNQYETKPKSFIMKSIIYLIEIIISFHVAYIMFNESFDLEYLIFPASSILMTILFQFNNTYTNIIFIIAFLSNIASIVNLPKSFISLDNYFKIEIALLIIFSNFEFFYLRNVDVKVVFCFIEFLFLQLNNFSFYMK